MTKTKKLLLGIATIWPILYMVVFFIFMFSMVLLLLFQKGNPPIGFFLTIFLLHFFTMIEIFVLLAIYVRDVFKNKRVEKDTKALWAVVLFLGNMIAMPIYWYLYIWKKPYDSLIRTNVLIEDPTKV